MPRGLQCHWSSTHLVHSNGHPSHPRLRLTFVLETPANPWFSQFLLVLACGMELVGYIFRTLSNRNPFVVIRFVLNYFFIVCVSSRTLQLLVVASNSLCFSSEPPRRSCCHPSFCSSGTNLRLGRDIPWPRQIASCPPTTFKPTSCKDITAW